MSLVVYCAKWDPVQPLELSYTSFMQFGWAYIMSYVRNFLILLLRKIRFREDIFDSFPNEFHPVILLIGDLEVFFKLKRNLHRVDQILHVWRSKRCLSICETDLRKGLPQDKLVWEERTVRLLSVEHISKCFEEHYSWVG